MLVPREMKLEYSGGVKAMSDEALENGEGATEPTVALRLGLWERTARTEILEQSTSAPRIPSADVTDAIEALVGPPERRLQKPVEIAHTDEGGIVHEQTAIAARPLTEIFLSLLSIANRCPLSPHKRRKSGYFLIEEWREADYDSR